MKITSRLQTASEVLRECSKQLIKKVVRFFVAAPVIEAQKKHYSREAYFVNGQAFAVYLNMFNMFCQ